MGVSSQVEAVLLLTARLAKEAKDERRPIGSAEWGRFALWLKEQNVQPEDLVLQPPEHLLTGWSDRTITLDRIRRLLGRGLALGLALEKWERAGLWVMTRSDPDYPARLETRLETRAPAVLFGCGNRRLLGQRGVAVVGSRDANNEDLAFASGVGAAAASQGWSVISGGARGVDQAAMLGALEREGTAIGVLSDNLLRATTSGTYRKWLMAKDLVLVSPFDPEVGFVVGNAMDRNKYIYCLSDAAIVVAASQGNGGTWSGALEDLKHGWVPLWVKRHPDSRSGNAALVQRGTRWLPDGQLDFGALAQLDRDDARRATRTPLPDGSQGELVMDRPILDVVAVGVPSVAMPEPPSTSADSVAAASLYDHFLVRLEKLTLTKAAAPKQLQREFGELCRTQLDQWLKRAADDGQLVKRLRPVRYQWQTQAALFNPPRTSRKTRRRKP